MAGRFQAALQVEVVFDDAVVDDDDARRAVPVRVGVLFARATVRRPARVGYAVRARDGLAREDLLEVPQFSGAPADLDASIAHHGDAGRVVPTVLQPPQPVDEHLRDVLGSDISD